MTKNLYEKELKQYAQLVVSKIGKRNAGEVPAIIQVYSHRGYAYSREMTNDLINLGICLPIPYTNKCEVIVSEKELNSIWTSYLFKRLILIKEEASKAVIDPMVTTSFVTFDPNDPIVRQAVEICLDKGKFSVPMLQLYLNSGHGYVSELALWLESVGVIGPIKDNKPREMLINSMKEFDMRAT